jgi:hypothetical protein
MQNMREKKIFISFFLASFLMMLFFYLWGYALSIDKHQFINDPNWQYQLLWFPVHVTLAYWAIVIHKNSFNELDRKRIDLRAIINDCKHHSSYYALSVLIVAPFIVEDLIEGYGQFVNNFDSLGYSTWVMIGPVWIIEWLMLGIIWLRVAHLAFLTVKICNKAYVRKHIDEFLSSSPTNQILNAGKANGLINLIYGCSSFGYIFYCGGEASDQQTIVISGLLVLFSFLTSYFSLRMKLHEVLKDISNEHAAMLPASFLTSEVSNSALDSIPIKPELMNSILFDESRNFDTQAYQRVCKVKLALLYESIEKTGHADFTVANGYKVMQYMQYEMSFSKFGHMQLYSTVLRVSTVLVAFADKFPFISKLL